MMNKKEIILEKNSKFITRYGTTLESPTPSVIYLRTKSKITPKYKKKDYSIEIDNVKKEFSQFIKHTIAQSKIVSNDCLFNIDISSKSVRYGKISFLRYDVYLKPSKLKTIEKHCFRMQQISNRFDKHLEKLLKINNIICK